MSEEMLSSIRQKFKQLIADACMTFQGTRGARHGVQSLQNHHYIAKEFMREIHKKEICTSILGRFQKNGANIWITSKQSILRTMSLQNNWNDTQRCIICRNDPKQMEKDTIKSRPDYHQTTRALVSMNKEAGQTQNQKRRRNYREDLDPEKLD